MTASTALLARPAPQPPAAPAAPAAAVPPEIDDLERLTRSLLASAAGTMVTRRAARTITGGPNAPLRQTIVALMDSQRLDDEACSQIARLQVLHGRVILIADGTRTLLGRGDWAVVPPTRHALQAVGDAAVLITTAAAGYCDGHRTAFIP